VAPAALAGDTFAELSRLVNPPAGPAPAVVAPAAPAPDAPPVAAEPAEVLDPIFDDDILAPRRSRRTRLTLPPRQVALLALLVAVLAGGVLKVVSGGGSGGGAKAPSTPPAEAVARARTAAGEATLRTAAQAAAEARAESGRYPADPAAFKKIEPALEWVAGSVPSTSGNVVSVKAGANGKLTLAVFAGSGRCAFGADAGTGVVQRRTVDTAQPCAATNAPKDLAVAAPESPADPASAALPEG
jgi:hypothetical protein